MDEIRIGLVGCGRITSAHLNGHKNLKEKGLDNAIIVALCDMKRENAEQYRKRGEGPQPRERVGPPGDPLVQPHLYVSDFQPELDAEVFTDYAEMLRKADLDAVEIYTSVSSHHEIALEAIRAGKHVLVQKPFAVSMKAAHKIVERAEKHGVVLGVCEIARFAPNTRMTRWMLDKGYIGNVQMATALSLGGFWSPNKIVAETSWRHRKLAAGGGAAIDMGVHMFHRLRYLVGEILEVNGVARTVEPIRFTRDRTGKVIETVECDADDTYFASLRFKNGAIGHVSFSWAGHGQPFDCGNTIYGSKGCIHGNAVVFDDGTKSTVNELFANKAETEVKEKLFPKGITNGFALQTLDFLTAIREGRDMETNGREGLVDLAVGFAVLESSLSGCSVKVEDILSGRHATYEREINEYYNIR